MRRLALAFLLLPAPALAPTPALADIFGFETPSGNIDCSVGIGEGPTDIMCTIYDRQGPPALPKPASCKGIWGHDFQMRSRGRVEMTCRTQPLKNIAAYEQAPYGVKSGFDPDLVCTSSKQGLDCRNADGHGFFLSRARQTVY